MQTPTPDRVLRQLAEDGLEDLGTIELGTTVVIGDPSALVSPVGSGQWFGSGVRPGTWQLLGRPWWGDKDLLDELILVHRATLSSFYTSYDEAAAVASMELPRHRLVVLDGALRADPTVLRSLVEVEELPWVMDRGCVLSAIGDNGAHVVATRATDLLAIGLGRAPSSRATTDPFSRDRDDDDV